MGVICNAVLSEREDAIQPGKNCADSIPCGQQDQLILTGPQGVTKKAAAEQTWKSSNNYFCKSTTTSLKKQRSSLRTPD